MTGPSYVEIGEKKRPVRRSAARFFLEWARERAGRIDEADPELRAEVLRYHEAAIRFWEDRLAKADRD
jgi:hypothetical protein